MNTLLGLSSRTSELHPCCSDDPCRRSRVDVRVWPRPGKRIYGSIWTRFLDRIGTTLWLKKTSILDKREFQHRMQFDAILCAANSIMQEIKKPNSDYFDCRAHRNA